jgi:L-alanine-DL-glutamate epimerase-like enolase superfamily enzyme
MKITGMKTRRLQIDAKPWYGEAPIPKGEPSIFEFPLVCVSTDEGIEGYTMGYGTNGEGRANAFLLHDVYLDSLLDENPLHHEAIWQNLRRKNRHLYGLTDTILGELDVALWDIKGKAARMSIAALLGIRRTKMPSYNTASYFLPTPEKVFDAAKRVKAAGYWGCKFNVTDGPKEDIPRLRAAREAVGESFSLMLDGSSFYTFTQALEVGRTLDELQFHWFEEPIFDRQLGLLKRLSNELRVPILAAETVSLAELPEFLRENAIDLARGDVHIKGGITGLRKAMATCELFGMNLEIHTAATPLLDVANLHVACATENCEFIESHHPMFRFAIKNSPLEIDSEGYLHLPDGPGLGVELDWDWIEDHTVEIL